MPTERHYRTPLRIVRTGGAYAASHEFVVIYPDWTTTTLWTPVWYDLNNVSDRHESKRAYLYAVKCWREKHGEEGL